MIVVVDVVGLVNVVFVGDGGVDDNDVDCCIVSVGRDIAPIRDHGGGCSIGGV